MEKYHGVVLYTDGGARPNPGFTGWGCHGYLYELSDKAVGNGNGTVVPTDKGYIQKKDATDDTQFVSVVEYIDGFGSFKEQMSNNVAELLAFIESVNYVINNQTVEHLCILTDSTYLIQGCEKWIASWEQSNWTKRDGQVVKNMDTWKAVQATLSVVERNSIDISILKVDAHTGDTGNELADTMATLGVAHSAKATVRKDIYSTPAKGYWKGEAEKHPLLSYNRLYFNTVPSSKNKNRYFLAEHVGDPEDNKKNLIGKRTATASYALVDFKEGLSVIDAVKDAVYSYMNGVDIISMLRVDRAYNKKVYKLLNKYGVNSLLYNNRCGGNVEFVDGMPMAVMLDNSCLVKNAIDNSAILEEMLEAYNDALSTKNNYYTYTDITNLFYTLNDKGKVALKKEITNEEKSCPVVISINEKKYTIPLVMGLDMPDRNSLRKLDKLSPKITLVTTNLNVARVAYNIVIECSDAVGVWTNFYANDIYL